MKKSILPYIIIAVFVAFGTFIISMVVKSMKSDVNLVSKDYYADELAYEEQIQKETRSKPYQKEVSVSLLAAEKMMRLQLPKELEKIEGNILLYRPSSSKMDKQIPLQINQHGEQYIETKELQKGIWLVKIFLNSANKTYYFEREISI